VPRRRGSTRALRNALLGAASYSCLTLCFAASEPAAAQLFTPGHFYDGLSLSVEGGNIVNASPHNLSFDGADLLVGGLPSSPPGRDGGYYGLSIGQVLGPWDWRLSWRDTQLGTRKSSGGTIIGSGGESDEFSLQTIDPEVGYHVPLYGADLRLFAGPRILNSNTDISYDATGKLGTFPSGTSFSNGFSRSSSLWGVGPRGGFEATVPFSDLPLPAVAGLPLSLSVGGSGAAIFGWQTSKFNYTMSSEVFAGTTTTSGSDSQHSSPVIYNAEASAGLNFKPWDMVTLTVGYRAQKFWDAAASTNQATGGGSFIAGQSDVLIHGPFARITVTLP
jgi:hypothetical protein